MSRVLALPLALVIALVPASCALTGSEPAASQPHQPPVSASWGPSADAPFPGSLAGEIVVPASGRAILRITLRNARFTALPTACASSTIVRPQSLVTADHARLRCTLLAGQEDRRVRFAAVTAGAVGDEMGGTVLLDAGDRTEVELPTIEVTEAPERLTPRLRLVSSPDFLNTDVGDLRKGPSFWDRSRSANGTNRQYEAALDGILDDWASTDPDGVLVAGDLVAGYWYRDDQDTGNFGRVGTLAERKRALGVAAGTYYPQWLKRFRSHGLDVYPSTGDHEYGDNPWPPRLRALAPRFRERFAHFFSRTASGAPRFSDRPRGPHALTAYAARPRPDVQVITLDTFDITRERARMGLDRQQLAWLRRVLRRAQRDGVRWTIVQGHVPILGPVRTRHSSGLTMAGGADSRVWRQFEKYGVDLYLSGEAHDVTVRERGGVTQVTHGGHFLYGLTNALLLDFYDDFVYLTLRDYDVRRGDAADGTRLWETRGKGMKKRLKVRGDPFTIGSGVLPDDGGLQDETGVLVPGL